MERDSSRCPDPEVLAAFVAGNLSGAELEMTVEHLRECEELQHLVHLPSAEAGALEDRPITCRICGGEKPVGVKTSPKSWNRYGPRVRRAFRRSHRFL